MNGAKASIGAYQKLEPKQANTFDSLGEIHFREALFSEAEQYFVRAFEMDNTLLGGGTLFRAALAAYLRGDRARADHHFRRYLDYRKKQNDPATALREAVWLYSTDRGDDARQKAAAV